MLSKLRKKKNFSYTVTGEGRPIVLLHGLMGELSDFSVLTEYFSNKGYKIFALKLPLYSLPVLNTNVKSIANQVIRFMEEVVGEPAILIGNSLGGHIGLIISIKRPELAFALCLTGSSGLYEKSFGESYPKRGSYEYVEQKTREVFYDPNIASKELIDSVFKTINDRSKAIKTLYIARSAIKHNLKTDLKNIKIPVCLIWGKQDNVTPPEVASDFIKELPNAELHWIDECGHAPMMEHPEVFNQMLHTWFNKIGGAITKKNDYQS